jgi:hypothetical protein
MVLFYTHVPTPFMKAGMGCHATLLNYDTQQPRTLYGAGQELILSYFMFYIYQLPVITYQPHRSGGTS